jgi:hypothetical protein
LGLWISMPGGMTRHLENTSMWTQRLKQWQDDPSGLCPTCPQGDNAREVYKDFALFENKFGSWRFDDGEWTDLNAKTDKLDVSKSEGYNPWARYKDLDPNNPRYTAFKEAGDLAAAIFSFLPIFSAPNLMFRGAVSKQVSNFGELLFLSNSFGITSARFGNSAAYAQGTLNKGGGLFKIGWSTCQNAIGQYGYKFRIGFGSIALKSNIARRHLYIPNSFVPNSFANPSIQVKRSFMNSD